jgi:hypothetical protein
MLRVMVVALVLLVASSVTAQDDINKLIDAGRKSVDAGDYQKAIEQFQTVVQKLQDRLGGAIERYFPDPPPGWEAGEIESQSWAGGTAEGSHNMLNITREYTRQSDNTRCTVTMTNWPQMVQAFQQSLQSYRQMQQVMQGNPDVDLTFEERDGWTVMKIVEKQSRSVQVTAVHDRLIVSVALDGSDGGAADPFVNSIDFKSIAASLK